MILIEYSEGIAGSPAMASVHLNQSLSESLEYQILLYFADFKYPGEILSQFKFRTDWRSSHQVLLISYLGQAFCNYQKRLQPWKVPGKPTVIIFL